MGKSKIKIIIKIIFKFLNIFKGKMTIPINTGIRELDLKIFSEIDDEKLKCLCRTNKFFSNHFVMKYG